MMAKYIVLICAWACLICGAVLIVLSFSVTGSLQFYGAALLAAGAVLSLVAILLRRRDKKRSEASARTRRKKKR